MEVVREQEEEVAIDYEMKMFLIVYPYLFARNREFTFVYSQPILPFAVVVDNLIVVDKLVAYTVDNVVLVIDESIRLAEKMNTKN